MKNWYTEAEVEELLKDAQKIVWVWIILGIIPGILIGMLVTAYSITREYGYEIPPMDVTPMPIKFLLPLVVIIVTVVWWTTWETIP